MGTPRTTKGRISAAFLGLLSFYALSASYLFGTAYLEAWWGTLGFDDSYFHASNESIHLTTFLAILSGITPYYFVLLYIAAGLSMIVAAVETIIIKGSLIGVARGLAARWRRRKTSSLDDVGTGEGNRTLVGEVVNYIAVLALALFLAAYLPIQQGLKYGESAAASLVATKYSRVKRDGYRIECASWHSSSQPQMVSSGVLLGCGDAFCGVVGAEGPLLIQASTIHDIRRRKYEAAAPLPFEEVCSQPTKSP